MPTAFVTGAGIRLGRAITLELAAAGHDVILHANRNTVTAEAVAAEVVAMGRRAVVLAADLSDPEAVARLADAVLDAAPALDVVVHNAGLFEQAEFGSISRDSYRRMQAVNLEAPFFLTQRLLPALRHPSRQGASACVIHVTDIGGERPLPGYAHYSVSKAGLIMLTKALAIELAPSIRVNAVSPGTVVFPEGFDEATRAAFLARIPLGREGAATDIAKAVRYLVCDAPYVTGHVLDVDGGRSATL